MTQEKEHWMDRSPLIPALNDVLADMVPRYSSAEAAIQSAEFRRRMDAAADRTPGVAAWLAEMPC